MRIYLFFHILGAILFLGNIVTAVFWKMIADRSADLRNRYQACKHVLLADYIFTLPGIVMLLTFGHLLVEEAGYSLFEWSWLSLSYLLFVLSGVIWMFILLPCQRQMIKWSRVGMDQGVMPKEYDKYSKIWNGFGSLSVLLPLTTLFMMVVKPIL